MADQAASGAWGSLGASAQTVAGWNPSVFGTGVSTPTQGATSYYNLDPNLFLNSPGDRVNSNNASAANWDGSSSNSNWQHFTAPDGTPMVAVRNVDPFTGQTQNFNVFKDPGDFGGTGFVGAKMSKMNGTPYDVVGPDGAFQGSGKFSGWKDEKVGDALGFGSVLALPFIAAGALGAAGAGAAGTGAASVAGGMGGVAEAGFGAGMGAAGGAGTLGGAGVAAGTGLAAGTGGALDLGGGIFMSADGVITGATPFATSALTNAGILESVGAGGLGSGAGALSGLNAVDLTGTGLPLDSAGSVIGSQAGGGTLSNAAIESIINGSSAAGSSVLQQLTAKLGESGAKSLLTSALNGGSGLSTLTSLLGPAASLVGGALTANAAGDAADKQLQAQREASALQEPWRAAGTKALNRMQEVLGIGGDTASAGYGSMNTPYTADSLYADPSYEFRKSEGMKGVTNAYASKGNFLSGGAIRGLDRYNQDYASTEYGKGWDRDQATKTNSYNRLASLAGTGQTAANTMGGYASSAGDAKAAGTMGSANAWTDAFSGALKQYQAGQQNATMQPYYDALTQRLMRP